MKRIFGLMSLATILILMSCSGKPAEVKKEVIVVPSSPVIIIKDSVKKPTTITLDKNGVKVETKKVDVRIGTDKKKQ